MLLRSSRNAENKAASKVPQGSKTQQFYNKYANDPTDISHGETDRIGPNGVIKLLGDLKLEPTDRRVLALVWKMQPERECEFTWDEWQKGLQEIGADSAESLRKQLDGIEKTFKDPLKLKPMYKWTFDFVKKPGQRNLDLDLAQAYWAIIFGNQWPLLELWTEFMEKEHKKPVTKDTWAQLFEFATTVNHDLGNYNEEESWPVVLDSFVQWARKRLTKQ